MNVKLETIRMLSCVVYSLIVAPAEQYWQCFVLIVSSIVYYDRFRLDLMCASGFIALLAAIVWLVDLVLTVRQGISGAFDDE